MQRSLIIALAISISSVAIVNAVGSRSNGDFTGPGDAQVLSTLRSSPCPVAITGDVNESGVRTSSDIILMVNYVFRSGPAPQPCEAAADVNCDGRVNVADVIRFIRSVFWEYPICDVCPLIEDGTWTCE